MAGKKLRYGYTTGACAAAAAKGAAQMLRDQQVVEGVDIVLPCGETAHFILRGQRLEGNTASCHVVKSAGDDPDVTNGAEIHATVAVDFFAPQRVIIQGGEGIGRVTKPGLAVPVGEWAINPVPRQMLQMVAKEVFAMRCIPYTLTISLSIPDGAELAKRTLNERLGIVGGLSILGTTGIVTPVSAKAWTDTIDAAIDVALACGADQVVLSTGRTSEMVAQRQLEQLHEEAFVMMGDHVGHALKACAAKGVKEVVIAGQFAKLLKIACGHEQTHAAASTLDLRLLSGWVREVAPDSLLVRICDEANTAREVLLASGNDPMLAGLVCDRVRAFAGILAAGVQVKVLLAGYVGEVLYFA